MSNPGGSDSARCQPSFRLSQLSSLPVKLRRTGSMSAAGTSMASAKSQKRHGAKNCRQLFKEMPPVTPCTSLTSSDVTTTASATSAAVSIVPSMFYGRGQAKAAQGVPSIHPFKQSKNKLFSVREALSQADESAITTASATTSSTVVATATTSSTAIKSAVSSEPTHLGMNKSERTADPKNQFSAPHTSDVDADDLGVGLFPSLIIDEAGLELSAPCASPDSPPDCPQPHSPESPLLLCLGTPASSGTLAEYSTPDLSPGIMSDSFDVAKVSGIQMSGAQPQPHTAPDVEAITPSSSGSRCRSKIWQHFRKIGNGQLAKCNHCGRELSRGKVVGHFTNSGMNQHMRLHHQAVLLREESGFTPTPSNSSEATQTPTTTKQSRAVTLRNPVPAKQPTLEQFGGFQGRGISRRQSRLIARLIGQLMAVGGAPFNMVESEPFRQLMQALAPQYHIPSRTTFSKLGCHP